MDMNTPRKPLREFFRSRRLTTTFALLATLSVGILAGSVLTRGVSGKEMQSIDSSDAHPITVPSPITLSNGFSQIVKQVGPAVVNINTESLPKPSASAKVPRRRGQQLPPGHPNTPGQGGDDPQQ